MEPGDQYTLYLGDRGRLSLPAALRRRLALKEGDRLLVTVEPDGTMRLASLNEQVRRGKGLFGHLASNRSLADELIADRREDRSRGAS
jgi:AbrB family looped-hinge helix DNA binding protein